jgi:hypothetical protein
MRNLTEKILNIASKLDDIGQYKMADNLDKMVRTAWWNAFKNSWGGNTSEPAALQQAQQYLQQAKRSYITGGNQPYLTLSKQIGDLMTKNQLARKDFSDIMDQFNKYTENPQVKQQYSDMINKQRANEQRNKYQQQNQTSGAYSYQQQSTSTSQMYNDDLKNLNQQQLQYVNSIAQQAINAGIFIDEYINKYGQKLDKRLVEPIKSAYMILSDKMDNPAQYQKIELNQQYADYYTNLAMQSGLSIDEWMDNNIQGVENNPSFKKALREYYYSKLGGSLFYGNNLSAIPSDPIYDKPDATIQLGYINYNPPSNLNFQNYYKDAQGNELLVIQRPEIAPKAFRPKQVGGTAFLRPPIPVQFVLAPPAEMGLSFVDAKTGQKSYYWSKDVIRKYNNLPPETQTAATW